MFAGAENGCEGRGPVKSLKMQTQSTFDGYKHILTPISCCKWGIDSVARTSMVIPSEHGTSVIFQLPRNARYIIMIGHEKGWIPLRIVRIITEQIERFIGSDLKWVLRFFYE